MHYNKIYVSTFLSLSTHTHTRFATNDMHIYHELLFAEEVFILEFANSIVTAPLTSSLTITFYIDEL